MSPFHILPVTTSRRSSASARISSGAHDAAGSKPYGNSAQLLHCAGYVHAFDVFGMPAYSNWT
jgi:hypothetical protein